MRPFALSALTLFAAPLFAADNKDDKKDAEVILGTWKVDKFDAGTADPVPASAFEKVRLTFHKDGKLTVVTPEGNDKEHKYKLDPSAKLKGLDITDGDETTLGLYELTGDTLKVCSPLRHSKDTKGTRPTEFKADGKGVVVLTLVRVKDEKKDK